MNVQILINTILGNAVLLIVLAVLIEATTEIFNQALPKLVEGRVTYFVSLIVGVALSFVLDVNLFGLQGVGHYAGVILAGLIASRGANYVNGFLSKFDVIR